MDTETEEEQIVKKQMEYLPQEVKDVFADPKIKEEVKALEIKYNLNEEQKDVLETENMLLMLALTHPAEYPQELKSRLNVDDNTLNNILSEINTIFLDKTRNQLEEAFEKTNDETEEDENPEEEQIDERLKGLSEETQTAIINSNYQAKLYDIWKENKLLIPQMDMMEDLLINVILGKVRPEDFKSVLRDTLQIKDAESKIITDEINEKILKEIRESLVAFSNKEIPKEKTELEELLEAKKEIRKDSIEMLDNKKILNDTGIEILSEENRLGVKKEIPIKKIEDIRNITTIETMPEELPQPSNEEGNKKIENPKIEEKPTESIASQKLSDSFQIPTTKTEYSPEKSDNTPVPTPPPKPPQISMPISKKTTGYRMDPYRLNPDEE